MAVGIVVLAGFSLVHAAAAARAAIDGKAALLRSETLLGSQQLEPARAELLASRAKFEKTRRELDTATRLLPIARFVPVVRTQIRGVETLADAGLVLSDAGISLADAAAVIVEPQPGAPVALSDALEHLRTIRGLLASGLQSIDAAAVTVGDLDGAFLPGPVGDARAQFDDRLPEVRKRAADSEAALSAMITFVGGNGPRRYLFLSQNPDEVRPTGGYIGTYGVFTGDSGKLSVDRFDSIESWFLPRGAAAEATPAERTPPFSYDPRLKQHLANVNTVPDWPQAAELAARLWERGGEAPVDGVMSVTPSFLARVLGVLGPVDVPDYGERVTSANLVERLDFYTHVQRSELGSDRKDFIAVLANVVMDRLIDAQSSQWVSLGKAVGDAFEAREAMVWSADPDVQAVLQARHWDGTLPQVAGDFVYPAEFEYAAKNGRAFRRSYSHHVTLHEDGSGTVTTTLRLPNPQPPDFFSNPPGLLAYITMYGPVGATANAESDPLGRPEPAVSGYPARGWFESLEPQSEATLTVVWDVPHLVQRGPDGSMEYSLLFMGLPDHTGDILQLSFDLPAGWKWAGDPPPARVGLDDDFSGRWRLAT